MNIATFWNDLPIRSKLLASVGLILAIFVLALGTDYFFLTKEADAVAVSMTRTVPMLDAAEQARRENAYFSVTAYKFHLSSTPKARSDAQKKYLAAVVRLDKQLAIMNKVAAPEDRALLASFATWLPPFDASKRKSFALFAANPKAAKKEATRVPSSDGDDYLTKLAGQVHERYQRDSDAIAVATRFAQIVTFCGGFAAVALGMIVALIVGNGVSKRLQQVSAALSDIVRNEVGALVASMKQLASGDLTASVATEAAPLTVTGKDESAQLAQAYNELVGGIQQAGIEFTTTTELLASLVLQIKTSVEQVNTAAAEIAEGSANLSQRTEEQASGLEETASSMEEFTATVKQNAESAQEANGLGGTAQGHAKKSSAVMGDVVATMDKINGSSQKIVEIISVIDGIAFQTNILALNAAVEAARAGEQGRGFAVVAGEVRSLAQRSSAAAKEIKGLIADTVAKVSDGSALVEQAGSSMQELVDSVERVTTIVNDIAAASREQSTGIDQVNKAIAQMDEVTQQNSALVEEAAAAAGSLEEQSGMLLRTVATFKVDAKSTNPAQVHAPVQKNRQHKHIPSRSTGDAEWTAF